MARAVILDKLAGKTRRLTPKNYPVTNLETVNYPKTVRINDVLPFRIRFTSVTIPGYNQNNIPGIGLQVIGYSNYIL